MDYDFLLIQKIQKGDENSAEVFVRKYYSSIFRYCLLHVRDSGYAEDIAQNTFMKFFAFLDRYRHYGKALNYLYVIASNECKDYHKKNKEICLADVSTLTIEQHQYAINSNMDIKIDIENAVAGLPSELKEVTILFFFHDIKQKDIAKILNISVPLVKYRIGRAKKLLSQYLKEG